MAQSNPFYYGNPVPAEFFTGRQWELSHICNRIISIQSTAIIGESRSGKSSVLLYLSSQETRENLYGEHGGQLLFSFIDIHALEYECTQSQFWEEALYPLNDSSFAQGYQKCKEKDFSYFELKRLFTQIRKSKQWMVLILDEFDVLLHRPNLNTSEFFGRLRSLSSLSRALCLVIASRLSLSHLNNAVSATKNYTGSPFFNTQSEMTLGPLKDENVSQLLERAENRFNKQEYDFIKSAAGEHPYLLQVAGFSLWEVYEREEQDYIERLKWVKQKLHEAITPMIDDTWQIWTPMMRIAFISVAIEQIGQENFDKQGMLSNIRDFTSELYILEKHGFVAQDTNNVSGWRVRPNAFLWWLADELIKTVRQEKPFYEFIHAYEWEWDSILTEGEKNQLTEAGKTIAKLIRDSMDLIKNFIKDCGS